MTELLHSAEQLLDDPEAATPVWRRATCVLLRAALEDALESFWHSHQPTIRFGNGRAQMACLSGWMDDPDLAAAVRQTWGELSSMAHHSDDLGPDPAAMRRSVRVIQAFHTAGHAS